MGKTFWGVMSAAVEQSVKPAWLLGEMGNSALEADPRVPPNQKKWVVHRDTLSPWPLVLVDHHKGRPL